MSILLTRRAVVLAALESAYNVEATTDPATDGVLVAQPEYTVQTNVLERNFTRNDLSPLAHVMGRKLAGVKFQTELRGNGTQNSGDVDDASIIARLFRGCGYALSAMPSPQITTVYDIDSHANRVAWADGVAAKATGTLTGSGTIVSDGDTVTIGTKIYTFQASLTNVDGNVKIGGTAAASLTNLFHAINGTGGVPGTDYAAATTAHPSVVATNPTATTVVVTAKVSGTAGNSIATTEASTNLSWGGATLSGGANSGTHTDVIAYYLEVTTPGASGTAEITVTSDTAGEGSAAAAVTTGTPFALGTHGIEVTPTFTGNLASGQRWIVWALPTGLRLDPISDDFESLTMKVYMDGTMQKATGCMGTFQITAEAGQFATIDWTFTGQYFDLIDAAMPSPTFERSLPAQVELCRLRMDDFSAVVAKFTFDQANDIQIRPDVNSTDGYNGVRLVGRKPVGGVDPEADTVANFDFWGVLSSARRMPFQMRVGTEAGNTVWMLSATTQYTGLTYQDRNGIRAYDAGMSFTRYNENDEMIFVLV